MKNTKRLIFEILLKNGDMITVDENLLSAEFGALDRGNLTDVVDWGIYANRGSFSFIDREDFFNNQNVNSYDIKQATVKIYLAKNERHLIATFAVDDCSFDDETRQVDIQLISNLLMLQNKKSRTAYAFGDRSALYLAGLDEDAELASADYGLYYPNYGIGMQESDEILEKTRIYCPYIDHTENAWKRFEKICQASMCRMIEDENGNAKIANPFPERTPIKISAKNILKISKGDRIQHSFEIEQVRRQKYEHKKLESVSRSFTVQYDEFGEPLSVSNSEYVFGDWEDTGVSYEKAVSVSFQTNSNFHIYRSTMSHYVATFEKSTMDGEKGTYSTEGFKAGARVGGLDNKMLFDSFSETLLVMVDGVTTDMLKSVNIDYFVDYFEDSGTSALSYGVTENVKSIPSNDLIQENSIYLEETGNSVQLAKHILQESARRYSKGIECFEIECLFNDYYYTDGSLAFDGSDLSNHFKKYDLIEPYTIKRGRVVPLRKNEDGTAKQFRIIGISYSYDGLLKQKLCVQEERYDEEVILD